ncbi:hypothetical protein FA15DRAFT_692847 [Coprinopsis marcescibilis]|uniref:Uncharacterized protein n=1 Tax=Coprinopsis marcescibilis TaxID=230819 RepID=A0A5C3L295_COPMA|nr:hypothetical protein FA15DRAFT_692847 [Coprinopsis marcescibilis]
MNEFHFQSNLATFLWGCASKLEELECIVTWKLEAIGEMPGVDANGRGMRAPPAQQSAIQTIRNVITGINSSIDSLESQLGGRSKQRASTAISRKSIPIHKPSPTDLHPTPFPGSWPYPDDGAEGIKEITRSAAVNLRRHRQVVERRKLESTATAPIQCCPPEIWGQIFSQCLPADGVLDEYGRKQFFALRAVCSFWRSVAYCTPPLWTGLAIEALPLVQRERMEEMVNIWFDRAGGCPLKLHIFRLHAVRDDEHQGILTHKLSRILSRHQNWLEFTLPIPNPSLETGNPGAVRALHEGVTGPWQNLRALTLTFSGPETLEAGTSTYSFPPPSTTLFTLAPRLTDITIALAHYDVPPPAPRTLSHPTVSHLTLRTWDIEAFAYTSMRHFIAGFPALNTLSLQSVGGRSFRLKASRRWNWTAIGRWMLYRA